MIRIFFIALSFFSTFSILSQEKREILNYRIDSYYDSINYESKWNYYGEFKNLKFYKSRYPTNVLDYINDTTLIEYYRIDSFHYQPYSYFRKTDTLHIKFNYYPLNKDTTHPQFTFNLGDTLWHPMDENYFYFRKSGKHFYKNGYTIYLGDELIQINDELYSCFKFKREDKSYYASDQTTTYSEIIYLDKKRFIPVKTITSYYTIRTDILLPFYSITYLNSITDTVTNFQDVKDLIIHKDTSLIWTKSQKKLYYENSYLNYNSEEYCNCLVNYYSGRVNYYALNTASRRYRMMRYRASEQCKSNL